MNAIIKRLAVTLFVMAVVVGCSPSTTTPAPTFAPLAVCQVAPNMDTIVGRKALASPTGYTGEPADTADPNGTGPTADRCLWTYGANPAQYVGVTLGPASGHAEAVSFFGPGEAVAGLGSEAVWWEGHLTLSVLAGVQSFQIDFIDLEQPTPTKALAVAIAQDILPNVH